jgi:hypothetical protein
MMKIRIFCTRLLAAMMLLAFLLVTGLQIAGDCSVVKQKSPISEEIELAALLPAHAPIAEAGLKFLKSVSDFCFFEAGITVISGTLSSETRGFFPELKPQFYRLLVACIAINAP